MINHLYSLVYKIVSFTISPKGIKKGEIIFTLERLRQLPRGTQVCGTVAINNNKEEPFIGLLNLKK